LGIIAEYNPFHLGHLYHLEESKKLINPDYTIAVMSGNFTQRGEPALIDKWLRTEAAIRSGIDLIIELPAVYATQTAEIFAYGGVQLLNHTGLVTHMSFGSEVGSLEPLKTIADILLAEDDQFKRLLRVSLKKGLSFPVARQDAIIKSLSQLGLAQGQAKQISEIVSGSNSILAIEYLKALKRTKSQIEPLTIRRKSSEYKSIQIQEDISSATSIRREIYDHGLSNIVKATMPTNSYGVLSNAIKYNKGPSKVSKLDSLVLGLIRRSDSKEISSWMDVEEGLENRIKASAHKASSISDLLEMMQTKRYVNTRLKRILLNGLLNLTNEKFTKLNSSMGPKYLRILGFSKRSLPLLKELKTSSRVPIITKPAHYTRYNKDLQDMFAFDILSTDIYALALEGKELRTGGRDLTQGPIIL
ncbi:MAG TPA: nucleotidyltransferase, partial [Bacillota bacterium]|nr:nucleotidyltransferase [Bacillota bacterium]